MTKGAESWAGHHVTIWRRQMMTHEPALRVSAAKGGVKEGVGVLSGKSGCSQTDLGRAASGIESALSSLKNFQSCISSGMDTASSVALDLVETQTEVSSEYSMDKAMVEFAMMDRELNHYVKAVQSMISHVKEERPEKIPDLKLLVEKKFLALQNKNSDADFQNNEKFVQFKQQLKELKNQFSSCPCLRAVIWSPRMKCVDLTRGELTLGHP
ncbi:E3 SUMO-protein ligase NSE2 isoform X2 [Manis pentadactyla]|uniref:E3 SUMO-protein ligase NSE2 isoform X2 n=1 Tax=Manis pentadactyla TaxID=143292 RepID=UPI00255C829C|nr:E3 SUMO-protein ligase NSE2 isoform X2 [Manis pentadactyla]